MVQRSSARALVVCFASLGGCGGEAVAPSRPDPNPASLYWRLTLNQQAVNLTTAASAPYDTFRLVATPRTADGTQFSTGATATFTSAEPEHVSVTPDGLVRGLQAATRVPIRVSLTDGDITHADTALVSVTANPPQVPVRLSLEPNPSDSAKAALPVLFGLYYPPPAVVARAFGAGDNEVPDLTVWIQSSDRRIAEYINESGELRTYRLGTLAFYASVAAYGAQLADTLAYTIGLPLDGWAQLRAQYAFGGTTPTYRFDPAVITIAAAGYVWWALPRGVPPFDVTFDNPVSVAADTVFGPFLNCGVGNTAGNIAPWGDSTQDNFSNLCSRHFPVAGTYPYHSAVLNAAGAIVVVDESQNLLTGTATTESSPSLPSGALATLSGLRLERDRSRTSSLFRRFHAITP